jgi:large subunit ribosomal protein L10
MPTDAKRETVTRLRADLAGSSTVVTTEYRGLTVKEIGEIRRALRKQDVTYRVIKNRLMRIAAEEEGSTALVPLLRGPSAIAFGTGEEPLVARAVLEAIRPYKQVRVTGAVVGKAGLDAEGVQRLATLPAREVLLAQMGGAFAAPATHLAGLFAAGLRNLAYALAQLGERGAASGA